MRATRIITFTILFGISLSFAGETLGQRFLGRGCGCNHCARIQRRCPCPTCQHCPQPSTYIDPNQFLKPGTDLSQPTDPGVQPTPDTTPTPQPDAFDLSAQFGGQTEGLGAPDMTIGDFFLGGGVLLGGPWIDPFNSPIAGGDRRFKVSDNLSPLPINRTFFNYHVFSDSVFDVNGNELTLSRYTFGLERTFWQNMASIEVRFPFAHGLNATQVQDFSVPEFNDGNEFGNLTLTTKFLLLQRCNWSFVSGFAVTLPTADDAELFAGGQTPEVVIENRALNIAPFFAYHLKPDRCSWITLATQLDFNAQGNRVVSNPNTSFSSFETYNDQNLLAFDVSGGRWFRYNPNSCRVIRGIAGIIELHYTTTINDADIVAAGARGGILTNPAGHMDVLNMTGGARFLVGDRTYATIAGVMPLRELGDRTFESEFNFNVSRTY